MKRIVWMLVIAAAIVTLATFWSTCQAQIVLRGVVKPTSGTSVPAVLDTFQYGAVGSTTTTISIADFPFKAGLTNPYLLVGFTGSDGSGTVWTVIDSVKFGTTHLARLDSSSEIPYGSFNRHGEWWGLANPTADTASLQCWFPEMNARAVLCGYVLSNVHQTSAFVAANWQFEEQGTTISVSVTSSSNEAVFLQTRSTASASFTSFGSGQDSIYWVDDAGFDYSGSWKHHPVTSMQATINANEWWFEAITVRLKYAP